jgi:hypothetical protein
VCAVLKPGRTIFFSSGPCNGHDRVSVHRRPPEQPVRTITLDVFLTAALPKRGILFPWFDVIGIPNCAGDVEAMPKYYSPLRVFPGLVEFFVNRR